MLAQLGMIPCPRACLFAQTGNDPLAVIVPTAPPFMNVQAAVSLDMESKLALKLRSSRVLTPYIPDAWECVLTDAGLLSKYSNIPNGLHFGFHAGLSNLTTSYYPPNYISVKMNQSIFDKIVTKEITKGCYIGPLNCVTVKLLIGPFQTAPLSLVPKLGKPGKYCLVQNLSFPYKPPSTLILSPNSRVDPDQFPTHYSTFQITATLISLLPLDSQAAVQDVAEAYRTISSHPSQWPSLVV